MPRNLHFLQGTHMFCPGGELRSLQASQHSGKKEPKNPSNLKFMKCKNFTY